VEEEKGAFTVEEKKGKKMREGRGRDGMFNCCALPEIRSWLRSDNLTKKTIM